MYHTMCFALRYIHNQRIRDLATGFENHAVLKVGYKGNCSYRLPQKLQSKTKTVGHRSSVILRANGRRHLVIFLGIAASNAQ